MTILLDDHMQGDENISAPTGQLSLRTNPDIVVCRQLVRRLTQELRFSEVGKTMLITAASELARNTVRYGGGGTLEWEIVRREHSKVGVRLTFEDHGPGIADLALAMTDRWTSGSGLGLGLSGAKRLVHQFSIHSVVGVGTRVTVTRWR